ncbi:unnamed protein product [Dovyalis caffra]|uniref:Uncharacterized protein n=1 Tax=Dovyalis caffra TaxID=77055 RepID=A0AAV1SMM8_9ROSI|nr:unnamed protein product [Dovyalis caffra]
MARQITKDWDSLPIFNEYLNDDVDDVHFAINIALNGMVTIIHHNKKKHGKMLDVVSESDVIDGTTCRSVIADISYKGEVVDHEGTRGSLGTTMSGYIIREVLVIEFEA